MVDDFLQAQLGKDHLGGHPFTLSGRCKLGELVAGLLLIGLGENLAQVSEGESHAADRGGEVQRNSSNCTFSLGSRRAHSYSSD